MTLVIQDYCHVLQLSDHEWYEVCGVVTGILA